MFGATGELGEAYSDEAFLDKVQLGYLLVLVINHAVLFVGEENPRVESVGKRAQHLHMGLFLTIYLSEEARKVPKDVAKEVICHQPLLDGLRQQQLVSAGVVKALHPVIGPIVSEMSFYLLLQRLCYRLPVFISLDIDEEQGKI